MFTSLLIALALAPADTPIEPIPAVAIEIAIDAGLMQDTCDLYAQVIPLFAEALAGDITLAMDVTDAYAISMFEEGWDAEGSGRLTVEATEVFTEYLHGCAL